MKKLFIACFATAVLLSLTGCDTDKATHSSTTTDTQTQSK